MHELIVEDLMTTRVYSIKPGEDLAKLSDLMNDLNIRHVPVADREGDIVGIVSQRDLLRAIATAESEIPVGELRDFLKTVKVEEIASAGVVTVETDTSIVEAAALLLENKMGCLPVVDNGHLVGILTEADFVKYVSENVIGNNEIH